MAEGGDGDTRSKNPKKPEKENEDYQSVNILKKDIDYLQKGDNQWIIDKHGIKHPRQPNKKGYVTDA
jgi:hypothetical protein